MKPSEKKIKLVRKLTKLLESLNVVQLYHLPRQDATQNWLADTAAVLKSLRDPDYKEFVNLSKTISPTQSRFKRKNAAYEINGFLRCKVAEWRVHYDN